ncbi:MAG: tRNA 2-thiouridine(34) synthase MnmA [Phycisphaerae bacterium]|nr:tRNA 2-thiouridine(34) synthase MnmA [Phycisphaerae bacterium]
MAADQRTITTPGGGRKVLLAMSGGVDSSVAAALLQRDGYEVVGCFMRLGSPGEELEGLVDPQMACRVAPGDAPGDAKVRLPQAGPVKIGHQGCCSINDAADARLVAAKLGIPFYVCNFKKDFGRIIDYFVGEYTAGRTPNPCVRCNDWLKFGKLHEYAQQIDAEFVASGHYARIGHDAHGRATLLRGIDRDKDQSYVLFGAPRDRLDRMMLPIGGLAKPEVRRLAQQFDLPVFDKPDSQEICFVPDNDYAGLLDRRAPGTMRSGSIVDRAGQVLGEHAGHQHFTVGQRRGLGIAAAQPLYVVAKDATTNTVIVGEREELLRAGCLCGDANWLVDHAELPQSDAGGWIRCTTMIRYNSQAVAARARPLAEGSIEIRFDEPQLAVAPGQAAVCFADDQVLCGGWIATAVPAT